MFKQKIQIPTSVTRVSLMAILVVVIAASFITLFAKSDTAVAAAPSTVNFQARLLTAAGAVVPDGQYNVEFKLYTALSGGSAVWTETRTSTDKVRVVNGYMTLNLGSVNTSWSGVDWGSDLWLTMNIGGTGSPVWDGEMTPRLKLTAVPYAFQANQAAKVVGGSGANTTTLDAGTPSGTNLIHLPAESGTLCIQNSSNCGFALTTGSGNYIQNQNTAAQSGANFWISGTGRLDTALQSPAIRATTNGTTAIQLQNAAGSSTAMSIDTTNNRVSIGNGGTAFAPQQALDVIGNIQVRDAATATKAYRLRTNGTSLDLEAGGADLYISNWSGGDFTGTQRNYLRLESGANIAHVVGSWQYAMSPSGTTRHTIDGTSGTDVKFNQDGEATDFIIQGDTDANLLFVDGSADKVGIGVAAPGYKLDVNGDINISTGSVYRINGQPICTVAGCVSAPASGSYIQNGTTLQTLANFYIQSASASSVGGIIRGAASQTSSLLQLLDGTSGYTVAQFSNNGYLSLGSDNIVRGGQIGFHDTTTGNGFTGTIITPAAFGANRTYTLPDESGTFCIQSSTNCGFAASTGSTAYIQNQNAVQQTSSNFWISGTGRADTAIQAPLIDTATAVALNIGTTNATVINLNEDVTVASGKTLTVTSAATSLTGATTGDALTVSNSTSTGNVAIFKDNSTAVFTIADNGVVTAKSLAANATAFVIQNSSNQALFTTDTFNNTVRLRTVGRDNTSTYESIWLQGSKNGVTALIGDNDDTSAYLTNDFSGNLRFNGSGVAWGDIGYYPKGGGNGNNGVFRFSTTGSAVGTTPNAKVGVGDLYVNGNAGIGTNTPGYKLDVAGDANLSSGSAYKINGVDICTSSGCISAPSSGSYIQNQFAGAQATSNFWISGTGRAATALQAPLLDAASAGVLNIGTTTATSLQVGSNTNNTAVSIDSGTGAINIGTGAQARAVNVGTGGAAQAVTVGSTSGASTLTLQAGTGTAAGDLVMQTAAGGIISIGNNAVANKVLNLGSAGTTAAASTVNIATTNANSTQSVTIGNTTSANNVVLIRGGTGTTAIQMQAGAGGTIGIANNAVAQIVNVGTGAAAQTVTVGSTNTTSSLKLDAGTGTIQIGTSASTRTTQIATGAAAQTVQIGSTNGTSSLTLDSGTGTINIGNGGQARSVNVGTGAAAQTVTVGSQNTTSSLTLDAGTGTIGIGTSASARTTNIATGAAAQTVTLGSTNGASSLLLQAGTGNVTIKTGGSASAFSVQDTAGQYLFNIDSSNGWTVNNGIIHPNNLLENPSFEAAGSFTATGWNFSGAASINTSASAHHGNKELVYTPNGTQLILSSYKYLEAQPGDQFYGEVWYKAAGGTNGAASFSFTYYDKNKSSIGSSSATNFSTGASSYTLATVTGTAPANTAYVRLTTGINASSTTGSWTFDDYSLIRSSQQAPFVFKNNVDSNNALMVQNTSGATIFNVNTSSAQVELGKASDTTGKIAFYNSTNSNAVTLQSGVTSSAYTLTLPTSLGTTGDCLKDGGSGALQFTACGNVSGTLQAAYTSGLGGTTPEIIVDSTRGGVDIQDVSTPGSSLGTNPIFAVRGQATSSTLGAKIFTVQGNGRVAIGAITPSEALDVDGNINITTGNAYKINGVSICTSSGCTPAAGSANYIQNQNAGQQSSSNFWISGTGRADNALQAPVLDAPTAAALNIGSTNATAINLNQNVTLASGKSLTLQGTYAQQPAADGTSIFNIKTFGGNNLFTVDSSNSRIGIALGSTTLPAYSGSAGIEIKGGFRLSGASQAYADNYTTPNGGTVKSLINIVNYDPGQYNQLVALGVPAGSHVDSRVMSLFDGRTVTHQPTLAVFSVDQNQVGGFSWDGGSTEFRVKNTNGSGTIALNVGGTNALTVNSSSVGIGMSPGSYKLDVAGDANLTSGSSYRINGTAICTSSGCTPAAGSANYIQNQSAVQQATSSFWVSGSGRVDGGVLTNNVTSNSGALILQAATNVISLGGSDTLTANGGFTMQSGTNSSLTVNANGTGTLSLGSNATSGRIINIGATGTQANTSTINIGTSTGAAQTINIGSTNGSGTTTINGGTGGVNLVTNSASAIIVAKSSTNTTSAFQVQNTSGTAVLNVDTTNGRLGIGTVTPNEKIQIVGGGINLGNTTNTNAGSIRWSGSDFEGYNGTSWVSMTNNVLTTTPVVSKRKAVNETVNASATFQDDDELFFNIGANETWSFRVVVHAISGTTPDFKMRITAPTGATCVYAVADTEAAVSNGNNACAASSGVIAGTGADEVYFMYGTVANGSTAGSVTLQWAQNTNTAADTTVYAGSSIDATRSVGNSGVAQAFIQGGNSFAATAVLGTNDNNGLNIQTNGTTRMAISNIGNTTLTGGTSGVALTVNNSTSTGNVANFQSNGTNVLTINNNGDIVIDSIADSATAFRIIDGSAVTLLNFDTTNGAMKINGTGTNFGGGRVQFGDQTWVYVGEYGTGDTDQLALFGNSGIYFGTSSATDVMTLVGTALTLDGNASFLGTVGLGGTAGTDVMTVYGNGVIRNTGTLTKQYRFRTTGSALDFEAGGAAMYLSTWTGVAFTGTQQTHIVMNTNGTMQFNAIAQSITSTTRMLCIDPSNQRSVTYSSSTTTCTTSSERYKKNIQNLSDASGLDAVLGMRPVTFQYKVGDETQKVGFIAEEMVNVVPQVIAYNEQGQIDGINYEFLTANIVKAIQQQQVQIDNLRNNLWDGGLVSHDTTFDSYVTFNKDVRFKGTANFDGKVMFNGKITYNRDAAGTAVIPVGFTSVDITFGQPYDQVPQITATTSEFASIKVINKTVNGFTIVMKNANNTNDVSVDWIANQIAPPPAP